MRIMLKNLFRLMKLSFMTQILIMPCVIWLKQKSCQIQHLLMLSGQLSWTGFLTSTDDTIFLTESLETRRLDMVEQFKKTSAERDIPLIHQHMMRTFALRSEEIVTTSPPVSELKDRWPALFHETQVSTTKYNIYCSALL